MLSPVLREELRGRKVLATDLDGTLLRPDLTIGEATRSAIRDAVAAGLHVVFVTGRPPRWMRVVAQEAGHAGTAICANGAVLLDLEQEQVLQRTTIDIAAAAEVAHGLRERYGPAVHFALERVAVAPMARTTTPFGGGSPGEFALESGYRGRLPLPEDSPRLPLADLLALPDPVKLLARLDDEGAGAGAGEGEGEGAEFLDAAERLAAGRLEVTHSSSHVLLEFGPGGVTKATALADLTAALGLERGDVVAAGDMPNDIAMLDWAGIGLAVIGGHRRARSAADHEVPGPSDDGIGLVLRAMLAE